jgi:hypothetical protein
LRADVPQTEHIRVGNQLAFEIIIPTSKLVLARNYGRGKARRAICGRLLSQMRIASSLETLQELLFDPARRLDLSYITCGAHIDPEHPPDGTFLFLNYPDGRVDHFCAKAYHRIDPVFRHADRIREPFWWHDEAFLAPLNARQKRLLNEARAFRIAYC